MNIISKIKYRKPESILQLERLAMVDAQRKHPTMLHLAPRKFRDDTANGLTACIISYLRLKGAFVSRINNTGVYDRRLRKYRRGTNRKGLPDILATYKGISLMIEVKVGRDRLNEDQKKIRHEQELSGGLFFVAHNFTEFKTWFDNNICTI